MNDLVVTGEATKCPFCNRGEYACPKCGADIVSKIYLIQELCRPAKKFGGESYILWAFSKIFTILNSSRSWLRRPFPRKKCTTPGFHFHITCADTRTSCSKCAAGIDLYSIPAKGCGGTWIRPVDEQLKILDMAGYVQAVSDVQETQKLLEA